MNEYVGVKSADARFILGGRCWRIPLDLSSYTRFWRSRLEGVLVLVVRILWSFHWKLAEARDIIKKLCQDMTSIFIFREPHYVSV